MINIIDHGTGNITSLKNLLTRHDVHYQLASEPKSLDRASHVIIPGVGHFKTAINNLKKKELDKAIINAANRGIPILGICLGMQMLYEYSEEGLSEGLGILEGKILKKNPSDISRFKVPNVGWLSVESKKTSSLFYNINNQNLIFYFANSYAVESQNKKYVTSTYNFDNEYVASLEKGNIYGTQFHPEKSGKMGHRLIKNFLKLGHLT